MQITKNSKILILFEKHATELYHYWAKTVFPWSKNQDSSFISGPSPWNLISLALSLRYKGNSLDKKILGFVSRHKREKERSNWNCSGWCNCKNTQKTHNRSQPDGHKKPQMVEAIGKYVSFFHPIIRHLLCVNCMPSSSGAKQC